MRVAHTSCICALGISRYLQRWRNLIEIHNMNSDHWKNGTSGILLLLGMLPFQCSLKMHVAVPTSSISLHTSSLHFPQSFQHIPIHSFIILPKLPLLDPASYLVPSDICLHAQEEPEK